MNNSMTVPGSATFPADWRFVLVRKGTKAPIGKDWQKRPIDWAEAIKHFGKTYQGSPVGAIGCLAGEVSGGLLFVDCDGSSGFSLLSSWGELPPTWEVSSGRTGRKQLVFRVGEQFWSELETTKFKTGTKAIDETGKEFEEGLELRWNGCQSLIYGENPISQKNYTWTNTHLPIAEAPLFLIEKMLKTEKAKGTSSQTSWREFDRSFSLPCQHTIPLPVFLRREDRDLIENGVDSGGRNDTGFKLAANLIATTEYLDAIGQRYDGIPEQLFEQYCQRCHQGDGWTQREWDTVWKSAQKGSKTPACPPDAMEASAKAWVWKNIQKAVGSVGPVGHRPQGVPTAETGGTSGVQKAVGSVGSFEISDLSREIRALFSRGLSMGELQQEKIMLRSKVKIGEREFNDLWNTLKQEFLLEDHLEGVAEEVNSLLVARKAKGSLFDYLPHRIAQPLQVLADNQYLRPECYLFSLLTAVSAIQKNGTYLWLHRGMNFRVTPNLFTAIVAESSQKKSPIIRTVATEPLRTLNLDAKQEYDAQMEFHKQQLKSIPKGEDPPEEPSRKVYYFTRTTGESILRQATRCPDQGMLWLTDELPSVFKGANQYRGGRGSDMEDMLEYYDGSGGVVMRAAGVKDDVENLSLGILGGIQPGVLERFLGHCDDSNGSWARFIFIQQPTVASSLPDDDGSMIDIRPLLTETYRRIVRYPEMEYRLTPEAFKYFQQVYRKLEDRRENDGNQAMRAVWGKTAGRIGKLAINLHVFEAAVHRQDCPDEFIDLETIVKATKLAYLSIQQIQSLYQMVSQSPEEDLPAHLAKVIELSERKGWIKARDVQHSFSRKKRPEAESVRQWFTYLSNLGLGYLDGTGANLSFSAKDLEGPTAPTDLYNTDLSSFSAVGTPQPTAHQQTTVPTGVNHESRPSVSPITFESREWEESPIAPAPRVSAQRPAMEAESSSSRREANAEVLGRQESTVGEGSYPFNEGDRVVDSVTGQESTVAEVMDDGDGLVLYFLNGSVNDYRTIEQISALQQQPVDIASTLDWKGFQVGDLVECVFPEWMDERSRKESAKMNEAPYGARGTVKELVVWDLQLSNLIVPAAIVEFEFGTKRLALDQLNRL